MDFLAMDRVARDVVDPARLYQKPEVALKNRGCRVVTGTRGHGIQMTKGGIARVRVPDRFDAVRRRFSLAHQLGHLVLGHEIPRNESGENFYERGVDPDEQAANAFAIAFLLPAHAVQFLLVSQQFLDVQDYAREFRVAEAVARIRLDDFRHREASRKP